MALAGLNILSQVTGLLMDTPAHGTPTLRLAILQSGQLAVAASISSFLLLWLF